MSLTSGDQLCDLTYRPRYGILILPLRAVAGMSASFTDGARLFYFTGGEVIWCDGGMVLSATVCDSGVDEHMDGLA